MSADEDEDDGWDFCGDLFAPFPYYGNKRRMAAEVWLRLGDVPNYIEACAGGAGVLLGRPHKGRVETLNDASGQIQNVWRSIKYSPRATALAADWIVSELDLHSRHRTLVERVNRTFVERLRLDPKFHDPELAGWWIWGAALWIGGGWCAPPGGREGNPSLHRKRPATGGQGGRPHLGRGVHAEQLPRKRPTLSGHGDSPKLGHGVHAGKLSRPERGARQRPHLSSSTGVHSRLDLAAPKRQLPHLHGSSDGDGVGYGRGIHSSAIREDILGFFLALSSRLRRVRLPCGDAMRVLTPTVTTSHGVTGVFLDPPYGARAKRTGDLYAVDSLELAPRLREWALKHGNDKRYRIALCGYEGEFEMPSEWECVAWKSTGASKNAARERMWFSPHCIRPGRDVGQLEIVFGEGPPA